MTRYTRNGLLGLMMAGLAASACQGTVGGTPGNGGSQGPGSAGSGSPGTGGSNPAGTAGTGSPGTGGSVGPAGTAGAGGDGGTGFVGGITCAPGVPATTQLRRMQNWQYDAVMRDLLGVTAVDTGDGAKPPSAQLFSDFDGPMNADAFRLYKDVGKAIAKTVLANATMKAKFIACDPAAAGTAGQTCLTNTIKTFGRKAFRRPLTDAEVARFMKLARRRRPERPPRLPSRSCTHSWCRPRSSRCPS